MPSDTIESIVQDLRANLDRLTKEEWYKLPLSVRLAHVKLKQLDPEPRSDSAFVCPSCAFRCAAVSHDHNHLNCYGDALIVPFHLECS